MLFWGKALFAQKTCNIWCFGQQSGLDFNYSPPRPFLSSKLSTAEGCSSVADTNGQLLFYTNGVIVWNKFHDTMLNGMGLFGDNSSTQSALIVKQPGNKNIYYVFTTDAYYKSTTYHGVCYSIVDINANNGLGKVIIKNQFLFSNSNEKIAATGHRNGKDIWIVSPKRSSDSLFLYLLTNSGINGPFIYKNNECYLGKNQITDASIGQMKFSGHGNLAYLNSIDSSVIYLLDFDANKGQFSNPKTIKNIPSTPYGLEFSQDGSLLFISTYESIYKIKLNKVFDGVDFDSCSTIIYKEQNSNNKFGALQLGPDARIYVSNFNSTTLSYIEITKDTIVRFYHQSVTLGVRHCNYGLPEFVQSNIYKPITIQIENTCLGDSVRFNVSNIFPDSIKWSFGDGQSLLSKLPKIAYQYADSGDYQVLAYLYLDNIVDTIVSTFVQIQYFPKQQLYNSTLCEGDTFKFNFRESGYTLRWSNGDTVSYFRTISSGKYWFAFSKGICSRTDTFNLNWFKRSNLFLGNDTLYCDTFTSVINGGNSFKKYSWNTGDSLYYINVSKSGVYVLNVIDSNGCNSIDSVHITQIKRPEIEIKLDTVTCQFVTLNAFSNGPFFRYKWNTGDTSSQIRVANKGKYSIVSHSLNCFYFDTINLKQLPQPKFTLGSDTVVCNPIVLSAPLYGQYLWSNMDVSKTYNVTKTETVWLRITLNNCNYYDTINIQFCDDIRINIPNSFTPNNDRVNDLFEVKGYGIDAVDMRIFNRWGELLFKGNNWNGMYQGDYCTPGVYFYIIKLNLNNGQVKTYNGSINLLY